MGKDFMLRDLCGACDIDPPRYPNTSLSFNSAKRVIRRAAIGLVPSFLQPRLRSNHRLHPTSYLDGLRGVASFIVFMGHYTEENVGWFTEPYGAYEDGAPSSKLQLPFIRVLYSSRPMVHIFFIISGYVLSYKPLKQIHSQQLSALATTLSSSVFRRAIRLFLPSIVTLFIMAHAVYFKLSDERYAYTLQSLTAQLNDWLAVCWQLSQSTWDINNLSALQPDYNPALWTIPVEFAQSLLLFTVILGLARCLINVRLVALAGLMAFCFWSGNLYTVEFLGGMFIAEITLLQDYSLDTPISSPTTLPKYSLEDPVEQKKCSSRFKTKSIKAFWIANVLSGLYIASWTNDHIHAFPGLRWLDAHTPAPYDGQRLWFCLGAFQIVGACTQLQCLKSLFTTSIAQYLGNISYALYLTHNLCLTILEPRFRPILSSYFPNTTLWGRQLLWAAGLALYLPIIICVADLFWRAVDVPTVKFARWLEGKCMVVKKA